MDAEKIIDELKSIALRWGRFSALWNTALVAVILAIASPEPEKSWWAALVQYSPRDLLMAIQGLAYRPLGLILAATVVALAAEAAFHLMKRLRIAMIENIYDLTSFIDEQYEKYIPLSQALAGKERESEIVRLEQSIKDFEGEALRREIIQKIVWLLLVVSASIAIKTLSIIDWSVFLISVAIFLALFFWRRRLYVQDLLPNLVLKAVLLGSKKYID